MGYCDNFEDVKVGDKVIYEGYFNNHVSNVSRVTPTCFEVEGKLFYKTNGTERGRTGSYYNCMIRKYTDERAQEIENEKKKRELKNKVNDYISNIKPRIRYLSLEQLEELSTILPKYLE